MSPIEVGVVIIACGGALRLAIFLDFLRFVIKREGTAGLRQVTPVIAAFVNPFHLSHRSDVVSVDDAAATSTVRGSDLLDTPVSRDP
jgi:hypothetical protein